MRFSSLQKVLMRLSGGGVWARYEVLIGRGVNESLMKTEWQRRDPLKKREEAVDWPFIMLLCVCVCAPPADLCHYILSTSCQSLSRKPLPPTQCVFYILVFNFKTSPCLMLIKFLSSNCRKNTWQDKWWRDDFPPWFRLHFAGRASATTWESSHILDVSSYDRDVW